jgi:hypothetical protein
MRRCRVLREGRRGRVTALLRRRLWSRPLWMGVGVGEAVDVVCVGKKRVAKFCYVGPGSVEGVTPWRKAQVSQGMQVCVTDSLLGAVEANHDSGDLWRSR